VSAKFDSQMAPPGGWITQNSARLPPVSRKAARPSVKVFISAVEKIGKLDAENLWLMLMHNPRMLRGMLYMASKLMPFGELDRIDTELVILRVAWNCRSRYEWGQHVDLGLRAGLTTDDIRCITEGPDTLGLCRNQVVLLQACDEFHRDRAISDAVWSKLSERFSRRLMLELLFLMGFYEGLAGVLNSTGLILDGSLESKLNSL